MSEHRQVAVSASPGERLAVAGLFVSLLPSIFFLTFLLGVVLFLVYRREKRYLAYHALLAALWQLTYYLINGLLYTPLRNIAVAGKNIAFVYQPWLWGHLSIAGQLTMTILFVSFVLNVGIAGWGVLLSLSGRALRLPFLTRLCERMLPTTSA